MTDKERTITFIVTKDCQLVCKYCYLVGKNSNERMTLDVAKKAIDKLTDNSTLFSEPSVVWDFIGGGTVIGDRIDKIHSRICGIKVNGNKPSMAKQFWNSHNY